MIQRTTRYDYIDALRGIAALYVVFGHALNKYYFQISSNLNIPFELLKQSTSGLFGVFLFFLISGYVIPSSFQGERIGGARRFVIRRFFRLYPLFWFLILPQIFRFVLVAHPDFSLEEILANLTMVPKLFDQKFICDVFWTLAHELLFYLICIILFLMGWIYDSRKIALSTLCTGLGYWLLRWGEWMEFYPAAETFFKKTVLICLSIMFWGTLWRSYQEKKCTSWLEKIALLFIPLQYLILTALRPLYTRLEAKQNFPISFGVSIAIAIGFFIAGTTIFKLKSRWLVWCGTVSYSIYLSHMTIIHFVARWFPAVPFFTFLAVVLIGSCLVAAFGYYFVERPFILLGKRIASSPVQKDSKNILSLLQK